MKKEIEKYVWYYLSVYIVVLLIFAAFQYFGMCDGQSLKCKTDWEKVKDILSTTAAIITPIVAIIGFLYWKEQFRFGKKVEYILEIRKEIRSLNHELFMLRNYFPLDISNPNDYENIDHYQKKYLKSMSKYKDHLFKIEDLFEDLNFLIKTNDKDRLIINRQLGVLKSFEGLSRSAHKEIYRAIKNQTQINITHSFAKKRAAYDALYDGENIETEDGKLSFSEGQFLANSINNLKNMCYEIYEEGYSKNRSLLVRLLDK